MECDKPFLIHPAQEILNHGQIADRDRPVRIEATPVIQRLRGVGQHRRTAQPGGEPIPGDGQRFGQLGGNRLVGREHVQIGHERQHAHGAFARSLGVELGDGEGRQALKRRTQGGAQGQLREIVGDLFPLSERLG